MSQKITAKNLTYDNALPPFLARLHGQRSAQTGPDPILASHRRPGQKRSASEEAEDAPLVVDEDGNVVDLDDAVKEAADGPVDDEERGSAPAEEKEEGEKAQKEKVAGIGATRKRKVGRVIGGEKDEKRVKSSEKDDDDKARIAKASADVRRLLGEEEEDVSTTNAKGTDDWARKSRDGVLNKSVKSAKKKPAKKIKLSFGDEDGD